MSRALATVDVVVEVAPIPDADAIERVRVRGWDLVAKKGEFAAGDLAVYIEVDSMLDVTRPEFAFLAARGVRTDVEGASGHVLKTARFRGQLSQGLALPVAAFPGLDAPAGADVTQHLGVKLWQPPVPASIAGMARGPKPSWFPTTDEERIQNIPEILAHREGWTATEKLDGTSMSVYVAEHDGVCSRNLDLLEDDSNSLWAVARRLDLFDRLRDSFAAPVVIQGELYGEGVQANPLKLRGLHLAVFNVLPHGRWLPRSQWPAWLLELSVPVLDLPFPATLDEALAQADALTSVVNPSARPEGIVWRNEAGMVTVPGPDGPVQLRGSVKVISNRYLLKRDR